jgi:DivIVA domain-containing protein
VDDGGRGTGTGSQCASASRNDLGRRDTIGSVTWVLWALPLLVIAGCAVLAAGWGAGMAAVYDDRPDVLVPADRLLAGDDIRRVGFTTAVRGYRMDEVDALLDRLAAELDARDRAAVSQPAVRTTDVTGDDRAG